LVASIPTSGIDHEVIKSEIWSPAHITFYIDHDVIGSEVYDVIRLEFCLPAHLAQKDMVVSQSNPKVQIMTS
jgi:hypothetical protein